MKKCNSSELSLKSYFLGPQAENSQFLEGSLSNILESYMIWRKTRFPKDGTAISNHDQMNPHFLRNQKKLQTLIQTMSQSFQKEIPQFSPRYFGHMFSELTLPGLLGHFTALLHNPNNISKESSRVGLKIEQEAIDSLYQMFSWKNAFGHLTSGGTVANLEALLRMRNRLNPKQWKNAKLLTSTAAHYSWKKNLKIIGLPDSALLEVDLDTDGRLSTLELDLILNKLKDPILGVVSIYGSTERGTVDEISKINSLIKKYSESKIWHHVDAAYGGFFACAPQAKGSYLYKQTEALKKVDSLTLDPHKLGYVPYGCGAFLCRKRSDYFYTDIEAPYIQFKSAQESGVQSVEGSRPATGAAATWLTARTIGFNKNGLGRILERHLKTKEIFKNKLTHKMNTIVICRGLDLNVLCWTLKTKSRKLSKSNNLVDQIFKSLPTGKNPYFISKTSLPLEKNIWLKNDLLKNNIIIDSKNCHLVRMTLMNPFLMNNETAIAYMDEFIDSLQISVASEL